MRTSSFLLLFGLITLSCLCSATLSEEPISLSKDSPVRIKSKPGQLWAFTFDESLFLPNRSYHIKYSWIGSIGIEIAAQWKYGLFDPETSYFYSLDSNNLHFSTNSLGKIEGIANQIGRRGESGDFDVLLVGFKNTRSRDIKAFEEPFEFIIRIEETSLFSAPTYMIDQFVLSILMAFAVTYFIIKSYSNPQGALNKFFSSNKASSSIQQGDKKTN